MFNVGCGRVDVPYLWDQTADAPPQAELNPLTNPVLERNLARWAQAYFGNPPGKREEAISRLLQEIRRETFESRKTEPLRESLPPSKASQDVVCLTCRHKNPLGQKFCGQCGETLARVASAARNFANTRTAPEAPPAQPESELQW